LTASTGTLTNPFQYTGHEFDPETGLRYYRARYYNPSTGRFVSEDPIGFAGGDNFFRYVGNSSTNFEDPLGLASPARGPLPTPTPGPTPGPGPGVCSICIPILIMLNPSELNGGEQEWIEEQRRRRCHDDDCREIEREIKDAMEEVESRIEDMLNDPRNLYDNAFDAPNPSVTGTPTTWRGHGIAVQGAKNRLYRAIMAAMRKGCPVPPQAWMLYLRGLPKMPRGR
jgi:RHS repeat-associated protein